MAYKEKPWVLSKKESKKDNGQLPLSLNFKNDEHIETNFSLSIKLGLNHATLQKVLNKLEKKGKIKAIAFKRGKSTQGYIINSEIIEVIKNEFNKRKNKFTEKEIKESIKDKKEIKEIKEIKERKREGRKIEDLSGQVFGRLTVLRRVKNKVGKDRKRGKRERIAFLCKCSCGNLTTVTAESLKSGSTRSCGCLRKDSLRKRWKKINKQSEKKPFTFNLFGWKISLTR